MSEKKLITVIGARPQFIKAAAVSNALKSSSLKEKIIHTGQHFDKNMSEVFFEEMNIPKPDYLLNINSMSHGAMTGKMLEQTEQVLKLEKPDAVMVYGDTNSTLAGALAAKKLNIKVIHIEAGLRSFNMAMPEEINRILTDRISDFLFCPTEKAMSNLYKEGFEHFGSHLIKSGDVMQDAAILFSKLSEEKSQIIQELKLKNKAFVLATIHRQENTDNEENLRNIIQSLNLIHKDMEVLVPLHPRTRKIIASLKLPVLFNVIAPVGYFDMLQLLKHCALVMTDSGGLQKEAFFFKKHCITLREETEWTELTEHGFNSLAGANQQKIIHLCKELPFRQRNFDVDLYGGGKAAETIVAHLEELL